MGLRDFDKLIRTYIHTFLDLVQKLDTTEITKTLMNQNLLNISLILIFCLKPDDPHKNYSFLTK